MEEIRRYSIGSLFAGIGGFELGLERAIPGAYTSWQVEQNTYCQKVLAKNWPEARIYDDVRNITKNNVEQVDILCGGFPCQDISLAGKGEGLHGKKSGLWWEMHRIIDELQPRAVIMENVAAINVRGLGTVLGSLSQIGYDAEWCTIRASDFGAPHRRARWFCIAYPTHSYSQRSGQTSQRRTSQINSKGREIQQGRSQNTTYSNSKWSSKQYLQYQCLEEEIKFKRRGSKANGVNDGNSNYWYGFPTTSAICRRDDGIPDRVDRIKSLGNAIVPQCSEWIGKKLWESGILQAGD